MAKKVVKKTRKSTASRATKRTAAKKSATRKRAAKKTTRKTSSRTKVSSQKTARKSTRKKSPARKAVKKKSVGSSRKQSRKSFEMPLSGSFYWKFPREDFQVLRIEVAVLVLLSAFVFLYMYLQPELSAFIAVVSVVLFLAIYFVVSAILRKMRHVEELYELSSTHLDIQRYVNGRKSASHKVALKDVKLHKFDHVFHGAYVVLHDGTRHPLYFSSGAESRHVERKLKGHLR